VALPALSGEQGNSLKSAAKVSKVGHDDPPGRQAKCAAWLYELLVQGLTVDTLELKSFPVFSVLMPKSPSTSSAMAARTQQQTRVKHRR
jgi:hypothetical protein